MPSFSLRWLYGEKGRLYDGDMADESTGGACSTGLALGESSSFTGLGCSVSGDVTGGTVADESTGFTSSLTSDGDGSAGGGAVALFAVVAGAADEGALRRGPLARFFVACVSCGPLEPLDVSLGGLGATGPGALLPPAPGGPRPIIPARAGLNLSASEPPTRAPTRGGAADSFGAAAGEGAGSSGAVAG